MSKKTENSTGLTEQEIRDEGARRAYVGGVISMSGSFSCIDNRVRMTMRSTKIDSVEAFASKVGAGVSYTTVNGKATAVVQISGNNLHVLMRNIWDLLPLERKREYARARRKMKF